MLLFCSIFRMLEILESTKCLFSRKKRFHFLKRLLYENGKPQNMPVLAGRLVKLTIDWWCYMIGQSRGIKQSIMFLSCLYKKFWSLLPTQFIGDCIIILSLTFIFAKLMSSNIHCCSHSSISSRNVLSFYNCNQKRDLKSFSSFFRRRFK